MSQFFIGVTQGNLPPTVPTSFTTDVFDNDALMGPGTVIPAANVVVVEGRETDQDNVNGIRTDANPNNGNNLFIELTNRISGSDTTSGASTETLYSFDLGSTPGTFLFWTRVVAFDTTTAGGQSASFVSYRAIKTDGATPSLVGSSTAFTVEEGTMSGASAVNDISGNNATFEVTGVAGLDINWYVLTEYIFVG